MPANIFKNQSLRHSQGFTLIEIVITIVILGAVAGILVPFFNAIVHSPDPVIRERAISLGQAMMDEIMAKRWDKNTPMGGGPICTEESPNLTTRPKLIDACVTKATTATSLGADGQTDRTLYDDVDDYNRWYEEDSFKDPTDDTKTFAMPGYELRVSVRYIVSKPDPTTNSIDQSTSDAPAGPTATGTSDTKLVVVTVKSPLDETFTFVAVACNI
jgi:MSHA pilin protein MshD